MTATDLLASGLGALRRAGLLLVAAGIALGLVLAVHTSTAGSHRIDGGTALRLATTTALAP